MTYSVVPHQVNKLSVVCTRPASVKLGDDTLVAASGHIIPLLPT
jgi:hypothetical protein